MSYFSDLRDGIRTTLKGLSLTARHLGHATHRRQPMGVAEPDYFALTDGLVTLAYPHEKLPIPDNGRYRLHNEIDDCIVCDKCAKVCPVDCITIDPIKATEEVGRASDGSPIRLYAATFDIDMAKCCYCGLCTAVCPTECLTMEKTFDYSTFNLANLTYEFANLTPEQADEKRALYEQFVQEKEAAKQAKVAAPAPAATVPVQDVTPTEQPAKPKPAFRPGMKPPTAPPSNEPPSPTDNVPGMDVPAEASTPAKPRPAFRPGMKPMAKAASSDAPAETGNVTEGHRQHPITDPAPDEAEQIAMAGVAEQPHVTEPLSADEKNVPAPEADEPASPRKTAPFRPTMKPTAPVTPSTADAQPVAETPAVTKKTAPFRPTMKPVATQPAPPTGEPLSTGSAEENAAVTEPSAKPKPAFRPTMKPTASATPTEAADSTAILHPTDETPSPEAQSAKPKPAFRPTMKPAAPKEAISDVPEATADVHTPPVSPVLPATESPDSNVPGTDVPAESAPSAEPRPAFRPTMKPATQKLALADESVVTASDLPATLPADAGAEPTSTAGDVRSSVSDSSTPLTPAESGTSPKPKPAFRPTMKPKSPDS